MIKKENLINKYVNCKGITEKSFNKIKKVILKKGFKVDPIFEYQYFKTNPNILFLLERDGNKKVYLASLRYGRLQDNEEIPFLEFINFLGIKKDDMISERFNKLKEERKEKKKRFDKTEEQFAKNMKEITDIWRRRRERIEKEYKKRKRAYNIYNKFNTFFILIGGFLIPISLTILVGSFVSSYFGCNTLTFLFRMIFSILTGWFFGNLIVFMLINLYKND